MKWIPWFQQQSFFHVWSVKSHQSSRKIIDGIRKTIQDGTLDALQRTHRKRPNIQKTVLIAPKIPMMFPNAVHVEKNPKPINHHRYKKCLTVTAAAVNSHTLVFIDREEGKTPCNRADGCDHVERNFGTFCTATASQPMAFHCTVSLFFCSVRQFGCFYFVCTGWYHEAGRRMNNLWIVFFH